ncbi:TetR/AcrR family transcriptional regulator [Luteipulveratus mongoliensis]|uniref:TetR family transcriptional regulator n=1 Tax=Luteipulveratus mongoliensis TaxID=571913 RepID=A0A0K1JL52_9MICO|nr:TetR/AcrR family transcriptional regulator [Luteipulveratus mongoliensis]AKU17452.1 TetR family transcriptional regulator [Luteipulveratus mongoliensis]
MVTKTTRMSATDRREQLLDAAARAFARGGYAGTSTDAIAREAGVSQPYVVRTFGTKAELFTEVLTRSCDAIVATFEGEMDRQTAAPDSEEYWAGLGQAYADLVADRDLLMVMTHGFLASSIPEVGAQSRASMAQIYRLLRDRTGCPPERAREFIAHGMLLNTLLAMEAPEHRDDDPALRELADCAFGPGLEKLAAHQAART